MNPVQIGRWHNRVRTPAPLADEQILAWQQVITDLDLDDLPLGESEEWLLIRRIQLHSRLDPALGEAAAAHTWRQALKAQLQHWLARADEHNLVRYPNHRAALADMLYRAACQDLSRAWAWRQMGLLANSTAPDALPAAAVLAAAADQLLAEPSHIWPLLSRLIMADAQCGAFTQLLRSLSLSRWYALINACPQTQPYYRQQSASTTSSTAAPTDDPTPAAARPTTPLAAALLHWVRAHAWQAQQQHALLTPLLAAALISPDGYSQAQTGTAAQVLSLAEQALHQALRATSQTLGQHAPSASARAATLRGKSAIDPRREAEPSARLDLPASLDVPGAPDLPAAPELPAAGDWVASQWVGLLFVLNLLPTHQWLAAFEALCEHSNQPPEPDLGRQLLWQLACEHLQVPASDASVQAFCGGWQPQAQQLESGGLRLAARLDPIARTLAAAIERRLAALGLFDLPGLLQRPGWVCLAPGWIEMRQSLERVDVNLRRAALDLNPDWLPWLGCVVRFVYV